MPTIELSEQEINVLSKVLRESAQTKKHKARHGDPNNRADLMASAMRDYELRKRLIAAKSANQPEVPMMCSVSLDDLVTVLNQCGFLPYQSGRMAQRRLHAQLNDRLDPSLPRGLGHEHETD